jgi:hypothetical protein
MIVTAGVMLYFGRRRLSRMARASAIAKIPQAEGLCHVRIVSC